MFKNVILGLSAVIVIVSAGMATNVQARFHQAFLSDNKAQINKRPALKLVDCDAGAAAVKMAGFKHVFAIDCSGAQYAYNGFRKEVEYTIVFNAQSGGMAAVSR